MQMYIWVTLNGHAYSSPALKKATYTECSNISASEFLVRNDTNAKLRTF
jgi:hypothetical protein